MVLFFQWTNKCDELLRSQSSLFILTIHSYLKKLNQVRNVLRFTKVVIFRAVRPVRNCQLHLLLKGAVACALWWLKVRLRLQLEEYINYGHLILLLWLGLGANPQTGCNTRTLSCGHAVLR